MKQLVYISSIVFISLLMTSCFGSDNKDRNAAAGTVVDTVKVYDTTYVEVKEVEKVRSHEDESDEYIPSILNEYVVASYGGYGVYLRYRPYDSAKTEIIYRDDIHFMGAPSRVPGWIMVVEDGRIVGYMPQDKVYESDYDYYEAQ